MFYALVLVFGGTDGVGSRFQVVRSGTHFGRCGWRRVPLSYFALPDKYSAVRGRLVPFSCFASPYSFFAIPKASGPIFMFCAPRLVFGGSKGVRTRFHVLRSGTHFRRYRVRRVPFSCFALPKTPELVFDGAEGVGSSFHVFALPDSFSVDPRASYPVFMFCVPVLVFGDTEGVGARFNVLRSWNRFWRCGGRRLLFS
jgi:hypothetical protein